MCVNVHRKSSGSVEATEHHIHDSRLQMNSDKSAVNDDQRLNVLRDGGEGQPIGVAAPPSGGSVSLVSAHAHV